MKPLSQLSSDHNGTLTTLSNRSINPNAISSNNNATPTALSNRTINSKQNSSADQPNFHFHNLMLTFSSSIMTTRRATKQSSQADGM